MKYGKPANVLPGKTYVPLARTDAMFAAVQVLKDGGENKLHSHALMDGFWFVLSGKVRFYGTDDEVVAECGPKEGVLVPHGVKYWFESFGDEDAELLQVETLLSPAGAARGAGD